MTNLLQGPQRWFKGLLQRAAGRGEFVVDMFAGGGGTSRGIEAALGTAVDIAINHDAHAIAIHKANHPNTYHFLTDVREVDPRKVLPDRPVGLLWLSPDCTHHSRAKGSKPVKRNRRALANVGIVWAQTRRPRVIILENVTEFEGWGPLQADGLPDKSKAGQSFKRYVGKLRRLGYQVEHRHLVAADYGAPTIRKRLFLIARRDGRRIVWPDKTHAPLDLHQMLGLKPWRAAAECFDFSLPTPSIFLTKQEARAQKLNIRRPLAENSLSRIAHGLKRFVINSPNPFLVTLNHSGQGSRARSLDEPWPTITAARDAHALVVPYLIKLYGTGKSADLLKPWPTITGQGNHSALVYAYLIKYFGTAADGQSLREPFHTITGKPRWALVTVTINGETYALADIGMRMPTVREILRGQFGKYADNYIVFGTDEQQVKAIGNSVPPEVAEALVRANYTADEAFGEVAA